jgi:hypothetical protein
MCPERDKSGKRRRSTSAASSTLVLKCESLPTPSSTPIDDIPSLYESFSVSCRWCVCLCVSVCLSRLFTLLYEKWPNSSGPQRPDLLQALCVGRRGGWCQRRQMLRSHCRTRRARASYSHSRVSRSYGSTLLSPFRFLAGSMFFLTVLAALSL